MTHSMPEDFAAKLKEARAKRSMVGERRVVTILFVDVKGSTEMAEQLDPEDWAEIMDQAFEHLVAPIHRYEGTVAQLRGDGVLAFFGAPISHEDDPQRAIMAGLEMLEEVEEFSDQLKEQSELDFAVRIGVNTGTVVVGPIGSDLAMEYTAMGDAVNLASRMEAMADTGTVQLAENTYRLVAPLFEVEPLGAIEVKGKREPVPAYRVLGRKTEPGRMRGIEGLSSPLIGRKDEFEKLKSVLEDFKNGRGGIVAIIGEAGLGKSRLIEELKAEFEAGLAPETPPNWDEFRGIPYEASVPYGLFLQHLRQTSGVTLHDTSETIHEKVAAAMEDAPSEMRDRSIRAIEILLTLAGQSKDPEDGSPLEGEALKKELLQALPMLWRGSVRVLGPPILVLDDLHWADDASVELLLHLFQLTDEMPVLIICAMRPYRDYPAWRIKAVAEREYPHRYTEIVLRPFAPGEEQNLARNLLDLPDLPKEMGDLILRKSEGNPFFVEELVRTFIDHGVVTREEDDQAWRVTQEVGKIPIPDNLQAVIVARMDRLEKEVQRTLQLASVIGRSFFHRVLQRISELEAELDQHLNTLERVELIREVARVPELEYMFRHELTRDAAYQSILKKRRREFHRKVGQALKELFPERQEELAPVLAHHFSEAGDAERALKLYTLAGDAAARLYANAEAIAYYSRALALTEQGRVNSDELIHLYTRLGRVLELDDQYDLALKRYEEMERLAQERKDRPLELAALMARLIVLAVGISVHDPTRGEALAERALSLAHELDDQAAEARILWGLTFVYRYTNRLSQAIDCGERSLALARELNLREQMAFTLNDVAKCYLPIGRLDRAKEAMREASDLWRELGNLPMLADNLSSIAWVDIYTGEYEQALALSEEAFQISETISNLRGQFHSRMGVGYVYWERGQPDLAIAVMEENLRLGELTNTVGGALFIRADLAGQYGDLGAIEHGLEIARLALTEAEESAPIYRSFVLAVLAQLHLLESNLADAQAAVDLAKGDPDRKAYPLGDVFILLADGKLALKRGDFERTMIVTDTLIANLRQFAMRAYIPSALYLQGQALMGLSQDQTARDRLLEAQTAAEAIGSRRTLWPILCALSQLEADPTEAERLRQQAVKIVEYIADHISTPELHASFLELPQVRAVFEPVANE